MTTKVGEVVHSAKIKIGEKGMFEMGDGSYCSGRYVGTKERSGKVIQIVIVQQDLNEYWFKVLPYNANKDRVEITE